MPKKGKKGGKKGKKKGKKKAKGPANADDVMKRLIKCYERNCVVTESRMCPKIASAIRNCAENGTVLSQFIFEPVEVEKEGDVPVLIESFLAAIRQERYTFIKDLYIWKYPMSYENTATLALLLEKPFYPIQMVELMDCLLDPLSVHRFARSFKVTEFLTRINLDYNEFGDEGCKNLCKGLEGNRTMLSISLCYCDLGVVSGTTLGKMVSTTAVRELYLDGNNLMCDGACELIKLCVEQVELTNFRELYLDGNNLMCDGACELIKLCVEQAELEALMRAEEAKRKLEEDEAIKTAAGTYGDADDDEAKDNRLRMLDSAAENSAKGSDTETGGDKKKKKKGKKKKKKKEPPPPPKIGPWIHKLHIADNAIDNLDFGAKFAPVICMRLFKKLLMHSDCIEELDLEDNCIGDLAGREILEALEHRKEEKMGGVKLKTTHKLSTDVFNSIVKLGSGLKKKKKKGKKKKK